MTSDENVVSFMCDCPLPLVNVLYRDGVAVAALYIYGEMNAEEHGQTAALLSADAATLMCPHCQRVYQRLEFD